MGKKLWSFPGRFAEGLSEAQAAIRVSADPHNAHKNLGVALEGLGHFEEAARAYIRAIDTRPLDRRAFEHLERLAQAHPELLRTMAGLSDEIDQRRDPWLRLRLRLKARTEDPRSG